MTPEQRNIAIAEACGWAREYADVPTWNAVLRDYELVNTMVLRREEKCVIPENLPDYINDLNTMQQAKLSLSPEKLGTFTCILMQMGVDRNFNFVVATAEQQAEAFLRTIDKWTTEP